MDFEVFLPLRDQAGLSALLANQQEPKSADYHRWLTPAQFSARFGPTPASVARVGAALTQAGLTVSAVHSRSLRVSATVAKVDQAFATTLRSVATPDGATRLVSPNVLTLPAALAAEGAVVVAFDGLPALRPASQPVAAQPGNRRSVHGPYYFTDLRQAYSYPALNAPMSNGQVLDGTGVKVGIVMSGVVKQTDVEAAFAHENWRTISGRPFPVLHTVAIDGGPPRGSATGREVSLDVQQVFGGAPGATVTVINTPNLANQSLIDAYLYVAESNAYDIVNSSIVGCELDFTAAYNGGVDRTGVLRVYDDLFRQGSAQGTSFMVSSGDSGGLACPDLNYGTGKRSSFIPSVSFPADSPNVTAVGGGNLVTSASPPSLASTYVSENAYGDPEIPQDPDNRGQVVYSAYWGAGGGLSVVFPAPAYQALVDTGSTTQRTLPDVGMQVGGCPAGTAQTPCPMSGGDRSAVFIFVDGQASGEIGTSVSAPEFVGATALYIQRHGRQGNLNTFLYRQGAAQRAGGATSYNTAIPGFDGKWSNTYPAGGYDYLVGNGTPIVRNLFGFTDLPAAGNPQTPSNP